MKLWNKTKIVATMGPASADKKVLAEMIEAGVDVIRINGAHGSEKEHIKNIRLARAAAARLKQVVSILIDLPGPKFRIGTLKKDPVILKNGEKVWLECGKKEQTKNEIPVPHPIHLWLKKGNKIFINDGLVELRVQKINKKNILCIVKNDGEIMSHKGLNLPGAKFSIPAITKEDKKILDMAVENGVDYLALSFVRSAKDILELKKLLNKKRASHIGVIAKIEKPEALDDLDDIIEASDAIMVARGDLGIELPFDQIPVVQRHILERCMAHGKPSITATQMLESMITSSRPTRAEATDVAGAVWEWTDAVMLSAETSVGKNPALAVAAMARIANEAEKNMPHVALPECKKDPNSFQAQILSHAASFIADHLHAKAIVAPTRSGRTPLFISRTRPDVPVFAPTEDVRIVKKMNLYWGVRPMLMPVYASVDGTLNAAENAALKSGLIKKGDTIVITSGAHGKKDDITRLVEVRKVGKR